MPASISIRNLIKAYAAASGPSIAVNDVSLEVPPGELLFLLGPSGCGKTTLLRMIAGFIEPTSGSISIDSHDVTALPANRRNTGMVFQSYALWPHMTVEANVAFGLEVRRIPSAERAPRVADALAAVRMSEFAKRRPNQLSGGQQQRVALARALVVRPRVLLLDEPLSNLDAKLRVELRTEIRRICKNFDGNGSAITTIYVTHDQKEALSMADRIAIMSRGQFVQIGTPTDLYRRPTTRFVAEFLGETNLVRGRILERNTRSTLLETPVGRLRAAGGGESIKDEVTCSIRPEAIQIHSPDETPVTAENRLEGRVTESLFLGDVTQLRVAFGNATLTVTTGRPVRTTPPNCAAVIGSEDIHILQET